MDAEENAEIVSLKKNLDAKIQEIHSANMQLNRLTANAAHFEEENVELRNELDEKEKEIARLTEICQTNCDQISSLGLKLKAALEDKQISQDDMERCESEIKHLMGMRKEKTPNSSFSMSTSFSDDKMSNLHEQLTELEEQKVTVEAKLSEAVSELHKCMNDNTELRQENNELKEEVDCIQSQLTSQCDINERIRQELQDMRVEDDTDSAPEAGERKGNSLFSEVEDRRIIVEKRMVQLQKHARSVEENLTKEVKENERLKIRIRQLRQAANKVHNEEAIHNILQQLEESKKKIAELTDKLHKIEKQPQEKTSVEMPSKICIPDTASGADKRFCGYLESLVKQSKQELEKEKMQHKSAELQLTRYDLLLTQKSNKLIATNIELDRLKGRNFDLSTLVRDLQQKYEPEDHNIHRLSLSDETNGERLSHVVADAHCDGGSQNGGKSLHTSRSPAADKHSLDKLDKENDPDTMSSGIPESSHRHRKAKMKSVGIREVINIVSEDGSQTVEELKDGDDHACSNKKLVKTGKGTGRYKSISYASNVSEMKPTECKQQ